LGAPRGEQPAPRRRALELPTAEASEALKKAQRHSQRAAADLREGLRQLEEPKP
jgi:hypothetical protein